METVTIDGVEFYIPYSPRNAELFDIAVGMGLNPKWKSCEKGYVRPDNTLDDAL